VLSEYALDCNTVWLVFFERPRETSFQRQQALSQRGGCSSFNHKDINEQQVPLGVDIHNAYATAR
jgi:hypothetical protein